MGQALRVALKNRRWRGRRGIHDRSSLDSSEEPVCRCARLCWPVGSPGLTSQPRGLCDAGFGHPPVAPLFRHSRSEMRDHRRAHSSSGLHDVPTVPGWGVTGRVTTRESNHLVT